MSIESVSAEANEFKYPRSRSLRFETPLPRDSGASLNLLQMLRLFGEVALKRLILPSADIILMAFQG